MTMRKPIKILFIDDDPAEIFILEEMLSLVPEFAFKLVHSNDLGTSFEILKSASFDIVLLDLGLPESTGIETLRTFLSVHKESAVIVVTGLNDFDVSVSAIESGAQDYIIKGEYQPLMLAKTIKFAIERKNLQEMAKRHSKLESLGTLTGGIAHEFNNMLGVILGHAELAEMEIAEWSPAKKNIEEIRKASLRAKEVVMKLMRAAQKMPTVKKPTAISDVIKESVNHIKKIIPETIDLSLDIHCSNETIMGDSAEINQVVMNLYDNAIYAMQGQHGVLSVRLEPIDLTLESEIRFDGLDPGKYVMLTIKDTGAGIVPSIMNRLYDPYFTTKDVDEGLGMGLAVVHGIVKNNRGAINIASEFGKGTTVEVVFPLTKE